MTDRWQRSQWSVDAPPASPGAEARSRNSRSHTKEKRHFTTGSAPTDAPMSTMLIVGSSRISSRSPTVMRESGKRDALGVGCSSSVRMDSPGSGHEPVRTQPYQRILGSPDKPVLWLVHPPSRRGRRGLRAWHTFAQGLGRAARRPIRSGASPWTRKGVPVIASRSLAARSAGGWRSAAGGTDMGE